MSMRTLSETVERLCEASRRKALDPYLAVQWPETIDLAAWYTSPELVSLEGTEIWDALPDETRKRLAFWEAVNFYSLNVHGEKALIEGLARRLYRGGEDDPSAYLHHFLDEENKHMVYFGGFCRRYAGKVYRDRKLVLPREYEDGEEDFLFFAKVLVFEELVDEHNRRMAKDERLAPVARQINASHHHEESRHLVFGREQVVALFERHASRWPAEVLERVRAYLASYLVATWKEYFNPDAYADAGLEDPYGIAERAFHHPAARARRTELSLACVEFLREHGMLAGESAP